VQVTLTVIDSAGRSDSARQAIVVRDGELLPPQVTLEAHPPRGEVPLRVFLLARASDADGTVERLEWNLGAGFAEGPAELWHTFTRPGRYPVVVRASDDDGLTALAALEVEVGREGQWPPFIYSEPVTEARVGRDYSSAQANQRTGSRQQLQARAAVTTRRCGPGRIRQPGPAAQPPAPQDHAQQGYQRQPGACVQRKCHRGCIGRQRRCGEHAREHAAEQCDQRIGCPALLVQSPQRDADTRKQRDLADRFEPG